MTAEERSIEERFWLEGARAIVVLAVTAAVIALSVCLHRHELFRVEYFWGNRLIDEASREGVVATIFLAASTTFSASALFLVLKRRDASAAAGLGFLAGRLAPLGPLSAFTCLFQWRLYLGHDLPFLVLVLLVALALGATV